MSASTHIDVAALRADLSRGAERVVRALLGEPTDKEGQKALRYRTHGSLRCFISGKRSGYWQDFEAGEDGDLIDLIERERSCDFRRAAEIASDILGGEYTAAPVKQTTERAEKTDEERRRGALQIFREAGPLRGTLGERYLNKREIDLAEAGVPDLHGVLRFHGACPFGSKQKHPCVIALFRCITTDREIGVQRIAIDAKDLTKIGRKSLGPVNRTVSTIKLWPDGEIAQGLVVGEGLETTLSAALIAHRGTMLRPAWALGSAGTMAQFPVLSGIDALTILVDHDDNEKQAGQNAAQACAARWSKAGREVIRLVPRTVGHDFNDIITTKTGAVR